MQTLLEMSSEFDFDPGSATRLEKICGRPLVVTLLENPSPSTLLADSSAVNLLVFPSAVILLAFPSAVTLLAAPSAVTVLQRSEILALALAYSAMLVVSMVHRITVVVHSAEDVNAANFAAYSFAVDIGVVVRIHWSAGLVHSIVAVGRSGILESTGVEASLATAAEIAC